MKSDRIESFRITLWLLALTAPVLLVETGGAKGDAPATGPGLSSGGASDPSCSSRACAHRGDVKHAPENTIPAIRMAVEKGAHQIEFDLQLSKDGKLILMHDKTLDRTTDGTGKATDMTFEELRKLDAGSWFSPEFAETRIPTFREVLEAIPPEILCNCHLKGTPEVAVAAAREIEETGRLEQCFLAATVEQAEAAKKVCPQIRICNMTRQAGPDSTYPEMTIELGCEFIQFAKTTEGLKESIESLHAHNVTVNYYHGSTEEDIRTLIEAGVDYILTDDLDLCLNILAEHGVKPVGQ